MPKRALPRVVAVAAEEQPLSLRVRWDRGEENLVDVSSVVERFRAYSPLRESPSLFRQVQVGEHGTDIVWADGTDMSADTLWRLTQEQAGTIMTATAFRNWREGEGYTLDEAAQALGLSRRIVAYYEQGNRTIPRVVALAIRGRALPTPEKAKSSSTGADVQVPHSNKVLVEKTRTIRTYAELWSASKFMLEAGRQDAGGSAWHFLSSLLLTAFSFEAYLNHAGSNTTGCWEDGERLSPLEKLRRLCKALNVDLPKGRRPLQTIYELITFRNTLAHGRTDEISSPSEERHFSDKLHEQLLNITLLSSWEAKIQSDDFARQARNDVEEVLWWLHAARPEPKDMLFSSGMAINSVSPAEK